MSKSIKSDSPIESQCGELYKLTFPEDKNIEDSYKYFSQDIGSQTEESEIIQILELTEALSKLTSHNADLHRNFNLVRSTLQSEFHRRLTNASNQLYSRMNQRLDDVERSQRDRVEVVRRAFRTQLSDALSHMSALYNKRLQNKSLNDRTLQQSEESIKYKKIIDNLMLKLKTSEANLKDLTKQLAEYQEYDSQPSMILDSDSERSENIVIDSEEINLVEKLKEELNKQKDLINELTQKIEYLNKQKVSYQTQIEDLNVDIKNTNLKLVSTMEIVDKLKSEKTIMLAQIDKLEKDNVDKQAEIIKPNVYSEKPKYGICNVQKNLKDFPDLSQEVIKLKETIQLLQNKEREELHEFSKLRKDLTSENKILAQQMNILQSINNKLKEEIFERKEKLNNFKTIHSASVTYAKNKQPIGILSGNYFEETKAVDNISDLVPKPYSEINSDLINNFVELKM